MFHFKCGTLPRDKEGIYLNGGMQTRGQLASKLISYQNYDMVGESPSYFNQMCMYPINYLYDLI